MKLSQLRQRIADAIAPPSNDRQMTVKPADLEPLDAPPIPPDPNQAQPLTPDQRANLEALRDRYAPDRQERRRRLTEELRRIADGKRPPDAH